MQGITFIGGGNMAGALIQGVLQAALYKAAQITVVDINPEIRASLQQKFGVHTEARLSHWPDFIVLAVKPQVMPEVVTQLGQDLRQAGRDHAETPARPLILSIAAGVLCHRIEEWLAMPTPLPLVRAMPNTPALVGQGMTGLFAAKSLPEAARARASALMNAVGQSLWVAEEALLDAVTALSGSGPAYVFYFLEAMQKAGEELGLTASVARQLAQATFIGAGQLAQQSPDDLNLLRERVTSKGGTTAAALGVLETAQVGEQLARAIHAAAARSKELGKN